MDFLSALWIPIVASAAAVWVAAAVIWMALPHHKSDFRKLPKEDEVRGALKGTGAGLYMYPYCDSKEGMADPDFQKKYAEGPTGIIVMRAPGAFNMGSGMLQSIVYNLVIAVFVAYVVDLALGAGADYLAVFRVTGAVTFLAYAGALVYPAIWAGRPWGVVFKEIIDGLVYALITAGIFGWLWPGA